MCADATSERCLPAGSSPGALETPPARGLAACPMASPVLLFLFPLRFSLVEIKFFLPVQEHQVKTVPSPQFLLDSRLSYLQLAFSSLAKEAQFV